MNRSEILIVFLPEIAPYTFELVIPSENLNVELLVEQVKFHLNRFCLIPSLHERLQLCSRLQERVQNYLNQTYFNSETHYI